MNFSIKVSDDRKTLTIVFESDTPLEVATRQEIEAKIALINEGFLIEEKPQPPLNKVWIAIHRLADDLGWKKA